MKVMPDAGCGGLPPEKRRALVVDYVREIKIYSDELSQQFSDERTLQAGNT